MTSDRQKWSELIPLYLAGSIEDKQRREFEAALAKNPQLRRELEEFAEIHEIYADCKRRAPRPSERIFRRVEVAVQAHEQAPAPRPAAELLRRLHGTLAELFATPRLSWALVAVQLVIIVVLVAGRGQTPVFQTLTSSPRVVHQTPALQVVFRADATERQIRTALLAIGAAIVDGPTAEGLYTLRLAGRANFEPALKKLRQNAIVRFAEKAY